MGRLLQYKGEPLQVFVLQLIDNANVALLSSVFTKYLPLTPSPVAILNYAFTATVADEDSIILKAFQTMLKQHDIRLMMYLLRMYHALGDTAMAVPTESVDILDYQRRLEVVIADLFSCNVFDTPKFMIALLTAREDESYENEMISVIQSSSSLVNYCLANELKVIFDKPQVNRLIGLLFYHYQQEANMMVWVNDKQFDLSVNYSIFMWSMYPWYWKEMSTGYGPNYTLSYITRYTHCLRANPAVTLALEGLSKVMLLWLIMTISVKEYGKTFALDYSRDFVKTSASSVVDDDVWNRQQTMLTSFTNYEIGLLVMAIADICYEVGCIVYEDTRSHSNIGPVCNRALLQRLLQSTVSHFSFGWNRMDLKCFIGFILWIFIRFAGSTEYFSVARVILTLISIPMSFGLLRYLSVYRPLGELIILIHGMMTEVINFVLIYTISVLGFGIVFYALFYSVDAYSNIGYSFLTLFGNTLGNFDTTVFATNSEVVNGLGIALLVIFVIFTAIVLMNLLIAQMSNSYQEIKQRAQQEWSFTFAKVMQEYILLQERNAFCILPPPLNIITISIWSIEGIIKYGMGYICGCTNRISWYATVSNCIVNYFAGTIFRLIHYTLNVADITKTVIFPRLFPTKEEPGTSVAWFQTMLFAVIYYISVVVLLIADILFVPLGVLLYESINFHNLRQRKVQKMCCVETIEEQQYASLANAQSQPSSAPVDEEACSIFTAYDIERILRPLRPYVRPLLSDDLFKLETNLSFECDRVHKAVTGIQAIQRVSINNETMQETRLSEIQSSISEVQLRLSSLENRFDKIESLLLNAIALMKPSK